MNKMTMDYFKSNSYRLGYRSDIEGIRAVAILLVIANHAGIPWLKGGFIGVDIFFVLSGYLITGLLIQEINQTGKLNLLNFYARRLRRLLPALLFMIFSISFISIILISPSEQLTQIAAARAASVWLSNMFFALSSLNYFDQTTGTNLFLHTWSLGVEEQFYLVWPLVILFLLGFLQPQRLTNNWPRLFSGMFGIIGLFFALSIFWSYTKPLWGFYLMPSRIWQFALGALALLWSTRNSHAFNTISGHNVSKGLNRFLDIGGWLGIFLILTPAIMLDSEISYPGAWASIPSLGTALILIAGAQINSTGITRILSISPLQWFGRYSYSWYLWHWPILIVGSFFLVEKNILGKSILVLLSLGLAILSFRFIESPIRWNNKLSSKTYYTITSSILLMLVCVSLIFFWQKNAVLWSEAPNQKRYTDVRLNLPLIYENGCDEWFYSSEVKICSVGEEEAKQTIVMMGDSMIGQWFPTIASIYNNPDQRLLILTKSSCPMVDEPFFYERIGAEYTVCSDWRKAALETLSSIKPDIVFLGSNTGYGFNQSQWISGTQSVLNKLSPNVKKIYLMLDTHQLPFDGPNCLARKEWLPDVISNKIDCSAPAGDQNETDVATWLKDASEKYANVEVVDLNSLICPNNRCYAEQEGIIVYRDFQHLSVLYAEKLREGFRLRIGLN